jgi:amino acid permease
MEAAANFGSSIRESVAARFRRHDSTFSVSSDYDYGSANDLSMWQGAALLTADCLGTGILALPHDIRVLGVGLGVGFLILNLPINLYAGTILSDAAGFVEGRQGLENENFDHFPLTIEAEAGKEAEGLLQDGKHNRDKDYDALANDDIFEDAVQDHSLHHDTATFDFIGMTSALFRKRATTLVMLLFYTNIFLVLGDYILVMSHAVAALLGESWLCIPQAGLLASTLMFVVSQLRTMANLGRSASIISLTALFIVVVQCLYFANHTDPDNVNDDQVSEGSESGEFSLLRKLSAMGSIGFAVGSQKLFLNIRHELADRKSAPKSLAISLSAFGTFYVAIVLSAGSSK